MEASLILADQIIDFIRKTGTDKRTAYTAIAVVEKVLSEVHDITFDGRDPEAEQLSIRES